MVSDLVSLVSNGVQTPCLNPCSNGIWSLTEDAGDLVPETGSLNPCSNGIWSLTGRPEGGVLQGCAS